MNSKSFHHISILLDACLDALCIRPDGVYLDATLGGAGHSLALAGRLGPGGRLICTDRDDEALANAEIRLAVITFHSLEDRIVKDVFRQAAQGCTCPPDFPVCVCGKKPRVKLIGRKPILPSAQEVQENARARSAKLRVCEKLD